LTGEQRIRNFNITYGLLHPAAHGVLRLLLELDGEILES
jgi:NADH-quinone oxidoreductase subunit D